LPSCSAGSWDGRTHRWKWQSRSTRDLSKFPHACHSLLDVLFVLGVASQMLGLALNNFLISHQQPKLEHDPAAIRASWRHGLRLQHFAIAVGSQAYPVESH